MIRVVVQLQIGKICAQRRKLLLRFLDPVLAEQTMAGLKRRARSSSRMRFGNSDQPCGIPGPAGISKRVEDTAVDRREAGGDIRGNRVLVLHPVHQASVSFSITISRGDSPLRYICHISR